jgi:hypothetical protein
MPEPEETIGIHLTICNGNIWHIDIFKGSKHTHIDIASIDPILRDRLCQALTEAARAAGAVHDEPKEIRLQ